MGGMPKVPESTKSSLAYKLSARARERWPQLADVQVTHRAGFAYVTGILPDGQQLPLCRLRYGGSASIWGFSIYRASHDDYKPSALPSGLTAGSPEDALDTACGLYLNDPTAWLTPPKD
jgi:choline dehydrogenase-like flavoprotein